jgi:membrane-bound lytic murein transglycosylase B
MRPFLAAGLFAGTVLLSACATTPTHAAPQDELDAFIVEQVREHGFQRDELERLLAQAEHRQDIIDAITRPAERLPWHRYRPIFLKPERIEGGVKFWNEHADLLQRLSRQYGVPPEIMVAIVGVETYYGRFKGKHRVLDALTTLAFSYPPRAKFFRSELSHYLLLAREEGWDPLSRSGSYAGAMGMPQFISSSYRNYAVDGDGDGKRNLFENPADALASVANYFARHGWETGAAVVQPAQVEGERWRELVNTDLKPKSSVAELSAAGVRTGTQLAGELPAKLLVMEATEGEEYWLALNNFYVITRYNHSPLYALAVYQLSQEIKAQREASR